MGGIRDRKNQEDGAERGDAVEIADPVETTVRYVDALFGPGTGERHLAFLERIENPGLRDVVLRCHAMEGNTTHLSLQENYLLGMCVLAAMRSYGTAAMFAKVLLHLGTPREKILEAVGRLSMWVGALPSAEAALVVQRAIEQYEDEGFASLAAWFPALDRVSNDAPTLSPPSSPPAPLERVLPASGGIE
jgi:hypothetical protein